MNKKFRLHKSQLNTLQLLSHRRHGRPCPNIFIRLTVLIAGSFGTGMHPCHHGRLTLECPWILLQKQQPARLLIQGGFRIGQDEETLDGLSKHI